jgi:hypothetical protein
MEDVLDELLNDEDDEISAHPSLVPSTYTTTKTTASLDNKQCHPSVLLGGPQASQMGMNSYNNMSCNALHCTSCDFRIAWFDGYRWSKSVDYLFLRNNAPDFLKLKRELVSSPKYRAYSCQCSWISVDGSKAVSNCQGLKWICGRH